MVALAPPLRGKLTVSSPYGWRTVFGVRDFHTGVDLNAVIGTMVLAAAAGTARRAVNGGGGWGVIIDHADGVSTEYWHLSARSIPNSAAPVQAGQLIGYAGASGRVTGPHLHFEVKVNGGTIDPMTALSGGAGGPTPKDNAPSLALGEITPEAPPGTYPDTMGSGGGRCDVANGWRDASLVETTLRPELAGYCVRITPGSILIGAATGGQPGDLIPIALNVGVVVGAVVIGWGGVKKVLGG